jgi:hypothetical protein
MIEIDLDCLAIPEAQNVVLLLHNSPPSPGVSPTLLTVQPDYAFARAGSIRRSQSKRSQA